jgi:PilZ domain
MEVVKNLGLEWVRRSFRWPNPALTQKRQLFRIAIDRAGRVQRGAETVPCHIVNLTEKGFRLRVKGSFSAGDILHLEFALTERAVLTCTVKATYARPPFVGAVITAISSQHQKLLSNFIDEVNAINLASV